MSASRRAPVARRSPRGFPTVAVASGAVVGFALGVLVDVIRPDIADGYQLAAVGLALAGLFVAIVARRRLPVALPFALAATVGLVVGIASGLAARPASIAHTAASIKVELRAPVSQSLSGGAMCAPIDGSDVPSLLTPADGSALALAGGRGLAVILAPTVGGIRRSDGLGIEVWIVTRGPDGAPTHTRMVSDLGSSLDASGTAATGSMTFSGLSLHPQSAQRQPIDVAGTVSWTCAPTP